MIKTMNNKPKNYRPNCTAMFTMTTALFILMIIFTPGQILSAEEKTLSVEECISIAGNNNSDIKIQKQRVEETRYKYYQQIGVFLPQVDATLGYTHYDKLTISQKELAGIQPAGERPELNDYTAGLIFNQVLFSGTKYYQLQSAKSTYEAESTKLEDTRRKAAASVKSAYYEQLRSSYMVKAQEELRDSMAEQKTMTELLYNSGKLTNIDLLKIKTQLSAYDDALENLKNLSYTRALMLGQVMGSDSTVYAERKLPGTEEVIAISKLCLNNKFSDNPEIAAARDMMEKAGFDKKTSYSYAFPNVSLRGSYYYEDTKIFPGNPNWYAGVAVTMPIFHGGTVYADVKQSQAKYEQSAETLKKTELSVAVRFQAASAILSDKTNRVASTLKTLDMSQEVLNATRLKYRTGKVTTIELIDAQITWNNSYLGYVNNIIDYSIARAEIESLCPGALRGEKAEVK